jgi:hypothetical protein
LKLISRYSAPNNSFFIIVDLCQLFLDHTLRH